MKSPLSCGLITGVVVCLWVLAEFALGLHTTRLELGVYADAGAALIPVGTFWLMLEARRNASADGRLAWGASLRAGLYASWVAAVVVYCFLMVYRQRINPGWMDTALDWRVARLRAEGLPETVVREEIVSFRTWNSSLGLVTSVLLGLPLAGSLLTLALTGVLRQRQRPAPPGG